MAKRRTSTQRGQSVLEYSLMVVVLIVVILAMNVYFKRALQGRWKETSDQVGKQFTTNEFYTIETRQQSAREEVTGTSGELNDTTGPNWTRSSIMNGGQFTGSSIGIADVGGKETNGYTGHETTRSDYVNQVVGGHQLGAHGTFDSGKLSNIKLFDDD